MYCRRDINQDHVRKSTNKKLSLARCRHIDIHYVATLRVVTGDNV